MSDKPSRDLNKFIVRFPDGMRDRIAQAAAASGRSMNAEIVHRLEGTFDDIPDRLVKLEAVVFDDEYNENLSGRVRDLEREIEALTQVVGRLRDR